MEPRRDDGDDGLDEGVMSVLGGAAMEPRRDDGDDILNRTGTATPAVPQWSPVVTTGTTLKATMNAPPLAHRRNGAPS